MKKNILPWSSSILSPSALKLQTRKWSSLHYPTSHMFLNKKKNWKTDISLTWSYFWCSYYIYSLQNLLSYIVNKLGDPSQKVASKVIYCLTQLLFKHINMQGVVLNAVEKLLFRPNISTRAQYYSLCFLSQYHLSHEAKEVARKLIEVYFAFFKACVKKVGIMAQKLFKQISIINGLISFRVMLTVEWCRPFLWVLIEPTRMPRWNLAKFQITLTLCIDLSIWLVSIQVCKPWYYFIKFQILKTITGWGNMY